MQANQTERKGRDVQGNSKKETGLNRTRSAATKSAINRSVETEELRHATQP